MTPAQQTAVQEALAKLEKHKNNCGVVAAIAVGSPGVAFTLTHKKQGKYVNS